MVIMNAANATKFDNIVKAHRIKGGFNRKNDTFLPYYKRYNEPRANGLRRVKFWGLNIDGSQHKKLRKALFEANLIGKTYEADDMFNSLVYYMKA